VKKVLYNKKGYRGEGDRQSFAFFIVGAVVVLIAVFLIGIYFGRELEKGGGAAADNRVFRAAGEGPRAEWSVQGGGMVTGKPVDNVQRELGAFSEEAVRIPVVPPGRAEAIAPPEPDNTLTFQETLSRKSAEPVPVEPPSSKAAKVAAEKEGAPKEGGVHVQAGAFKDREKAEARLKSVEKAGFKARVARSGKDGKSGLYLVVTGPFRDREKAKKAIDKLKTDHKIDAILAKG
jgi:hypothetical protein